jgi:hypothetical protein
LFLPLNDWFKFLFYFFVSLYEQHSFRLNKRYREKVIIDE